MTWSTRHSFIEVFRTSGLGLGTVGNFKVKDNISDLKVSSRKDRYAVPNYSGIRAFTVNTGNIKRAKG